MASKQKELMMENLVSLRKKKEPKRPTTMAEEPASERDLYPYGTRLHFSNEEVKKLGLADMQAGQQVVIAARGTVTSVRMRETQGKEKDYDVDVQIEQAVVKPNPKYKV